MVQAPECLTGHLDPQASGFSVAPPERRGGSPTGTHQGMPKRNSVLTMQVSPAFQQRRLAVWHRTTGIDKNLRFLAPGLVIRVKTNTPMAVLIDQPTIHNQSRR